MLTEVLDVLRWTGDHRAALDRAESTYTSELTGRLGRGLRALQRSEPEVATRFVTLLGRADARAVRRVVLAPETCSRLLWGHPGACDDRDLWRYLIDSLEVEATPSGPAAAPALEAAGPGRRWSALGDRFVDAAHGTVVTQPTLAGLVVDSDSPAAVCFDYSSLHRGGMRLRHFDDPAAKDVALRRVEAAMRGLEELDGGLADFVRRFTLVAGVVVDAENPKFTSGSTGQYIGRSILCNAHGPTVDVELLAESLVHEAIHALLSMHELDDPWVLDEHVLAVDAVVESPWSGVELVLRPFLQACFVWFGLAHLWSLAEGATAFRPARVAERLARARQGFERGPLRARIAAFEPHVAPAVLELVEAMQRELLAAAPPPRAPRPTTVA